MTTTLQHFIACIDIAPPDTLRALADYINAKVAAEAATANLAATRQRIIDSDVHNTTDVYADSLVAPHIHSTITLRSMVAAYDSVEAMFADKYHSDFITANHVYVTLVRTYRAKVGGGLHDSKAAIDAAIRRAVTAKLHGMM